MWAMVGGAGAGALYGIGGAGLLVGTMVKSRSLRGFDIVLGFVIFSAAGAFVGAFYGLVAGLLVGLAVSPVVAVFLMRPMVRALPAATRTRRAQVVAFVTTFGVTALPVLGSAIASGELGVLSAVGIPAVGALAYAPYAGARVASRLDGRHAGS
jgi:hypothetical protein